MEYLEAFVEPQGHFKRERKKMKITQQEVTWECLGYLKMMRMTKGDINFSSNTFLFNFPLIYIGFFFPISQHARGIDGEKGKFQ